MNTYNAKILVLVSGVDGMPQIIDSKGDPAQGDDGEDQDVVLTEVSHHGSNWVEDLPFKDQPTEKGMHVWEGTISFNVNPEDGDRSLHVYEGTWRRARHGELIRFGTGSGETFED
jgi:hypothetical protein